MSSSEAEDFDLGAISEASESDFEEIAPKAKVNVQETRVVRATASLNNGSYSCFNSGEGCNQIEGVDVKTSETIRRFKS